ncbi:MAG: hypothetical protein OHK0011_06050 [Turneriella sp.]
MAYGKKFRVPGLKRSDSFADSQQPVLSHYLRRVLKQAKKFSKDGTAERLHNLRIALRRFRYVLELYATEFKPKKFRAIYDLAVRLQNTLGDRRDIDVMHERLLSLYRSSEAELPALISADLEQSKALLNTQIEHTLAEFVRNPQLRKLVD